MSSILRLPNASRQYQFSIGSPGYFKGISALYERKEKCTDEREVGALIDEINLVIRALESAGSFEERCTALVLRSHQTDNLYCKSGHAKRSVEASRSPLVGDCQEKAENEAATAEAEFKRLEEDVETADEKLKCSRVGVWVYGYSAMQKLIAKDFGAAKDLLQIALRNLRQIHPKADTDTDAEQREGCLLESGFLNNCQGRLYRDSYNSKRRHSHRINGPAGICKCKETACDFFKDSLKMFVVLENEMADGSFRHERILMNINIVRTLLGNPDEKVSWGIILDKDTLDLCEKHMEEALALNKRWGREEVRDRLNFRLELFQGYLCIKQAMSKSDTLSTNNSVNLPRNGCGLADTEYAKKAELCRWSLLENAAYCFQQCQQKFGVFYSEMRVVPEVVEWIKTHEVAQVLKLLRDCEINRHNGRKTSDTGTSGGRSSSESGAGKKRSRNPSLCENQSPQRRKHRKQINASAADAGNSAANTPSTSADGQPTDVDGAAYGHDSNPTYCLDPTEEPQFAVHSSE